MPLSKIKTNSVADEVFEAGSNMLINGAMKVDQRNTTVTTSAYSCDRWFVHKTNFDELVFAADQDTTSPDGFSNSLKVAVTTAETALASDELFYIRYQIEGQDLQHLNYGTSSAKSVTLSFYVRSSLTGKYSILFFEPTNTRSNTQSFTINSADTWEYKTITIDGDTTGSLTNDNSGQLQFYITLAAGTDYTGTPHSGWGAYSQTDDYAFSDQVDFSAQTGTFYLTGVQLEVGEQATPFEVEPFSQTKEKCMRYFQRIDLPQWYHNTLGATHIYHTERLAVEMRASGTGTVHTTLRYWTGGGAANINPSLANYYDRVRIQTQAGISNGNGFVDGQINLDAEL